MLCLTRMETWRVMLNSMNAQEPKALLTVRLINQTGAQAGSSDPAVQHGMDAAMR